MSYYFYHNPDVVPHIKIHKSSCGHCQKGKGKHKDQEYGKRGVWTGEFDKKEWAIEYIENNIKLNGYSIEFCKICNP